MAHFFKKKLEVHTKLTRSWLKAPTLLSVNFERRSSGSGESKIGIEM